MSNSDANSDANSNAPLLRMERDMSLEEVERISAEIIDLINQGKSLAQATNYVYTPVGTNNPELVAIQNMSPSELSQYRASKTRGVPFKLDIEKHRLETPDGAKQFPRMALALDRIFQTTGHTRENVAYVYRRFPGHIPLVKAYLKLINAERDAISNANVSLDLFQEYQTCRKILGNAQYVFQHCPLSAREQSVMIRRMQTIMERRMADLAGSKLRSTKRDNHQRALSYSSKAPPHNHNQTTNESLPSPPASPKRTTSRFDFNKKGAQFGNTGTGRPSARKLQLGSNPKVPPPLKLSSEFALPLSPSTSWIKTPPPENVIPFDCSRTVSRFYSSGGWRSDLMNQPQPPLTPSRPTVEMREYRPRKFDFSRNPTVFVSNQQPNPRSPTGDQETRQIPPVYQNSMRLATLQPYF